MACCRRQQPLPYNSKWPTKQLDSKLSEIKTIISSSREHTIVSNSGQAIYPQDTDIAEDKVLLDRLQKMKVAALSLGEKLTETNCSCIHIKGQSNLFSCYDIGADKWLAFYSESNTFDNSTSVNCKISTICEDIRQIMQGHDYSPTST